MPRKTVALLALAVTLALAPSAGAAPASYRGSSDDGRIVFFETEGQLVPGDTDLKRDVYERYLDPEPGVESYVTREVTLGPAGGNDAFNATFEAATEEGTEVFFSTAESLVEEDADHSADVYMRDLEEGTTTLLSRAGTTCSGDCGNGPIDASFAGAGADGQEVFFVTQEKLITSDQDSAVDIYERSLVDDKTTLVSAGSSSCPSACGNGPYKASLLSVSGNASRVYFTSEESLAAADGDTSTDIYVRELGGVDETRLVSQAGEGCVGCGNAGKVPIFQATSESGARAFFSTEEKLVSADDDGVTDVYARNLPAGPTTLVTDGTAAKNAIFAGSSSDGSHVFFNTVEPLLTGQDEDETSDIYEWSSGEPLRLVTTAPCPSNCGPTFDAASSDSQTVIFSTAAKLSPADEDEGAEDVYAQAVGGAPKLVSRPTGCAGCGNGTADATFDRASDDATHVVFTSSEPLTADDGDIEKDIYSRDLLGESTSLMTTSPSYCPFKKGNCGATFVDSSADGSRVFFTTAERFTLDDGDDEVDVYERFLGATPVEYVTRLVSTGNSPDLELAPPAPVLEGTTPDSPAPSTSPRVIGKAEESSTIKIYSNAICSGEPVAHGSAAEFSFPGIAVTVAVGETAKFWATAETEGFVSACAGPISYQQQSPGPGGEGGDSGGGGGSSGGGGGSTGGSETGGSDNRRRPGSPGGDERVVYVAPHTRITFAPAAKTRNPNPVFRFTDATGQRGTRFSCKLDHHPWKRCHSPLRLKNLSRGRHTLEVKAVNAVGTHERRPSIRRFKVVPR